jgi:hypothetical protein
MEEEVCSSKKRIQKSKRLAKKQERRERVNARVLVADSDPDDF